MMIQPFYAKHLVSDTARALPVAGGWRYSDMLEPDVKLVTTAVQSPTLTVGPAERAIDFPPVWETALTAV